MTTKARIVAVGVLAVLLGCGMPAPAVATEGVSGEPVVTKPEAPGSNYASLSHLVTMVCDDAMERFYDFFGASPVAVEPFQVVGEFLVAPRVSLLGATLADQMSAGINNEAVAQPTPAGATTEQRLRGLLQEMDGYLRIHMSGQNSRGEWRSYVVTVEMSEPIYRALHSYVVM